MTQLYELCDSTLWNLWLNFINLWLITFVLRLKENRLYLCSKVPHESKSTTLNLFPRSFCSSSSLYLMCVRMCVCVSLSLSLSFSLSLYVHTCVVCVCLINNINMLSHAYIRTNTHNHSHSHSYICRRSQRDKVDIYTHIHITAATATLIFVDGARETVSDRNRREQLSIYGYGVATMSRMLKNTGLFAEYRSLL